VNDEFEVYARRFGGGAPLASALCKTLPPAPPLTPGDPSDVTLTTGQLLINQRISQAAVRRANELIARIEDGLLAGNVRDGTVTAVDLAPGVAVP
jgi:hypothetical protein